MSQMLRLGIELEKEIWRQTGSSSKFVYSSR